MTETLPASAREHVAGLLALLNGNLPAAPSPPARQLQVYSGGADPTAGVPYVVLYADPGWPDGTLGDRHRWLLLGFQVTAVGSSVQQAQWASDWARTVLLTMQPTVPGRIVHPLWQQEGPPPVTRDDDVSPPLYYQPALYQMRSVPA